MTWVTSSMYWERDGKTPKLMQRSSIHCVLLWYMVGLGKKRWHGSRGQDSEDGALCLLEVSSDEFGSSIWASPGYSSHLL